MIGRFLLGAGLGALVGTGLLAIASVVMPGPGPRPAPVKPVAAPAEKPVVAEEIAAPEEMPAVDMPADPEPEPETVEAEVPAEAPVVADAPEAPSATVADDAGPEAPSDAEEPSVAATPSAPAELAGDDAPGPAEVPAAAPGVEAAAAPEAPAEPETGSAAVAAPEPQAEAAPPTGGPVQPEAPVAEAAPAPAEPPGLPPLTPEEEEMLARIAADGPGSALPPGETVPEALPEPAPEAVEAGAPAEKPSLLTEREDDKILRSDESKSTLPSTPALAGAGDDVTAGRLPQISAAEEVPAVEVVDTRPITAFAQPFDNPEGKPAFAIVLIDEGDAELDRAALAALPFPVTFALDPTDPKVADHAAIYRGAGQEVAMLATALPVGAQAADVEVAISAMAAMLPEAVAVMDLPSRAFQADRPLATMVVPAVGAGGRGLLTWDQGLNAADQVARREDIPAAVAFRDLDGADEAAPVIRRYLDRAAFKAAQEGRVTVVGRTRPETVAVLLEWAVEGRAATVALAPLTAVLSVD